MEQGDLQTATTSSTTSSTTPGTVLGGSDEFIQPPASEAVGGEDSESSVPDGEPQSGLTFRSYNSISNNDSAPDINKMNLENHFHPNIEWVMTEKIHGANFSVQSDGITAKFSKRRSTLEADTTFHQYQELVPELTTLAHKVYSLFAAEKSSLKRVIVYGELFGGTYPHDDVPKLTGVKFIQKGVFYCPDIRFYAFDIWVQEEHNYYLDFDTFESLCKEAGFFYSLPMQRGSYNELKNFDVENFVTTIPGLLDLPPKKDNISEGVVLKPVVTRYLSNGSRVILKLKSDKYKEITGTNKAIKVRVPKEVVPLAPEIQEMVETLYRYVNEARLRNVLSKIGPVKTKELSKVMGLLSRDALKDFVNDNPAFSELKQKDQKSVKSRLAAPIKILVLQNAVAIVAGDF